MDFHFQGFIFTVSALFSVTSSPPPLLSSPLLLSLLCHGHVTGLVLLPLALRGKLHLLCDNQHQFLLSPVNRAVPDDCCQPSLYIKPVGKLSRLLNRDTGGSVKVSKPFVFVYFRFRVTIKRGIYAAGQRLMFQSDEKPYIHLSLYKKYIFKGRELKMNVLS